ncbi:cilia- and flagella-associated protein 95 [Ambystoma mexicanum]|uniref:cilia- and flagella-associated protein 95 n=1 Tax=Ambystoma mexicanum TaxID=8296 RepID=UPI0037E7ED5D
MEEEEEAEDFPETGDQEESSVETQDVPKTFEPQDFPTEPEDYPSATEQEDSSVESQNFPGASESVDYSRAIMLREVKGSLTLRANHLVYGKPTLVYNWHESRQSDPKDYDVSEAPQCRRDLRKSAYHRFGTVTQEDWKTTTNEQLSQIGLKKDYTERDFPKSLITQDNINSAIIDRETCRPKTGYGAVLPHHSPDYRKMHLKTTYNDDFVSPCYFVPRSHVQDASPLPAVYKKCHSQFADTADHRRFGINTWQDESGVYANKELKQSLIKRTDPITPWI